MGVTMQEVQLIGTFDSAESAAEVARALNNWFLWIMEEDEGDMPAIFEDFGLSSEEYALDQEADTDWEESPTATADSNHVIVTLYTAGTQDVLQEMLEALGAFEVEIEEGV